MANKYLEKLAKEFRGQYGHAVDVHGSMGDKHSKIYTPEIQAAQNRRSGRLGAAEKIKTQRVAKKVGGRVGMAVGAGAALASAAIALKKKKKDD